MMSADLSEDSLRTIVFPPRALAPALCASLLTIPLFACGSAPPPRPAVLSFAPIAPGDPAQQAAAVVRIRVQDGATVMTRTGVLIDPRGYVLTTFSSIGVAGARLRAARPGTLFGGGEGVRIEVFEGPFDTTPAEYVGRVVRGDLRLNLALLRITGTDDAPLDRAHRFAAVDVASSAEPSWGSFGWLIGATANHPTLLAHHSNVATAMTNSEGTIAGYVLSSYDPALEGAAYFDATGAFTGIHVSGFIRPGSRMPGAWREAMSAGEISDRRIDGIVELVPGEWAPIAPIGDAVYAPGSEESRGGEAIEEFVFAVPGTSGGTLIVEPPVSVTAYQRGRALQSGTGEIFIPGEPDVYVVVRMPRPSDPSGLRVRVRFERAS